MQTAIGGNTGGRREGAGRKPASETDNEAIASYNAHRARHEAIKADSAELELSIKRGQYLARDPIRSAAATAVAAIVQALRSLPDNLEREFSLEPEVVESISMRIDEALADLGKQFKAMSGE